MSEKPRPWQWARIQAINPLILNSVVAVLLFALYAAGMAAGTLDANHGRPADVLGYLFVLGAAAPIAFRRSYPLTCLAVASTAVVAYTVFEYPENGMPISILLTLYTVASWLPRRRAISSLFVILALAAVAVSLDGNTVNVASILNNWAIFTAAFLVGYSVHVRRDYVEQLELRAADLERTRHEEAEHAVAAERLRIARELHDVVAHTMSVVAVQSGIAAHVMDKEPEEAKRMMESIAGASRDALAEMRGLLGVLRSDDATSASASFAPAPTLDDLEALAEGVTNAGVPVTVHVDGDPANVPKGVHVSAYRIVQEALTNVLKHAGPAAAEVTIVYSEDDVAVEIVDSGRGAAAGQLNGTGGGHGIVGMRERVGVYGGTLDAGPASGGGYRVAAHLPYATAAERQ